MGECDFDVFCFGECTGGASACEKGRRTACKARPSGANGIYTHLPPPRVCVCLLCVFAVVREEVVVAARKEREKVITDDMTVGRYR